MLHLLTVHTSKYTVCTQHSPRTTVSIVVVVCNTKMSVALTRIAPMDTIIEQIFDQCTTTLDAIAEFSAQSTGEVVFELIFNFEIEILQLG